MTLRDAYLNIDESDEIARVRNVAMNIAKRADWKSIADEFADYCESHMHSKRLFSREIRMMFSRFKREKGYRK